MQSTSTRATREHATGRLNRFVLTLSSEQYCCRLSNIVDMYSSTVLHMQGVSYVAASCSVRSMTQRKPTGLTNKHGGDKMVFMQACISKQICTVKGIRVYRQRGGEGGIPAGCQTGPHTCGCASRSSRPLAGSQRACLR